MAGMHEGLVKKEQTYQNLEIHALTSLLPTCSMTRSFLAFSEKKIHGT